MTEWYDTSNGYKPIKPLRMTMAEPNIWTVKCVYPSSGPVECTYYFQNWLNFNSNLAQSDGDVIPEDAGRQEVVIPFYTHQYGFTVQMVNDQASDYQNDPFYTAESFVRAVRELTNDLDKNWKVTFKVNFGQKGSPYTGYFSYDIYGKISAVGLNFNPRSHVNLIDINFVLFEDTE